MTGYPETFVLDAKGRIAAARRGPITQQWVDEHVTPLLDERHEARSPLIAARGRAGRRPAAAAAAEPRASLPDIEDEVMCVECGTRAERLAGAGRRPRARGSSAAGSPRA